MSVIRIILVVIVAGIVGYVLLKHPDEPETIDLTKSYNSDGFDEFGYDENGYGLDGRDYNGNDIYGQ